MSVREYILQFNSLARYAPTIVSKMEWVHRFVMGLEPHLLNDCMSVSLQPDMDISRIQAYAQGVKEREPVLEWKGNMASPRGRFISYLKARKMIRKGCIHHLVRVQDVEVESPTIQCIPVVNEFLDVFPNELSGLPPEQEIEFAIDLLPDNHPISIPPYSMTPAELKELKEQLKDLLEKGFIRLSTSPYGAPVLFVRKKDGSLRMCIDYR
ncbi:uncharacterized protein [Nicotiana tomentosiformis]|uniref:uncharacterized protein n=1 Tax=Nicotiana tomentosiformis TaxID=4098 RepID=UPI00388CA95E